EGNYNEAYSYLDDSGDTVQLVTSVSSSKKDWMIVSIQPYESMINVLNEMKTFTFLVVAVLIVLTMGSSLLLTSQLYNPVSKVIRQIRYTVSNLKHTDKS